VWVGFRLLDLSLVEQLAWYEPGGEAEETAVECADRSQAAGVLRCTQNDTLFLRGKNNGNCKWNGNRADAKATASFASARTTSLRMTRLMVGGREELQRQQQQQISPLPGLVAALIHAGDAVVPA
jgi:hypothetical protein